MRTKQIILRTQLKKLLLQEHGNDAGFRLKNGCLQKKNFLKMMADSFSMMEIDGIKACLIFMMASLNFQEIQAESIMNY